ncbi:MAG TPA: carboxypeptidase-like regulatory domain-containing protein [Terracidiphilus sp.]|nr:carboxypeptidase-like regulatory domain-containing protein [Terracidiphilus sp.]
MTESCVAGRPWAAFVTVCLLVLSAGICRLHGQTNAGAIQGTVLDQSGQPVQGATVAAVNDVALVKKVGTGSDGKFAVNGLPGGTYTVEISTPGFSTVIRHGVIVTAGTPVNLPIVLSIASVSQEVTVEAEADNSLAAQLSPVKSVLDAGSARTEITSQYVDEFTSPITDFSDITNIAPGTVSWSTNGVGLGQAVTYFRGFVDDDYTMTWDGIPFEDSNDPATTPGPMFRDLPSATWTSTAAPAPPPIWVRPTTADRFTSSRRSCRARCR